MSKVTRPKTHRCCRAKVTLLVGDIDIVNDFQGREVILTDYGADMRVETDGGYESCCINEYGVAKGQSTDDKRFELVGHSMWVFERLTDWQAMYEVEDDAGKQYMVLRAGDLVQVFPYVAKNKSAMHKAVYAFADAMNKTLV